MSSPLVSGLGELLSRMARAPAATAQLLAITGLITLLGLAGSLYVIQVLNRFVTHGVAGTLVTLSVGTLLAIAAEHQLRKLRWLIAEGIAGDQDRRLATGVFGLILTANLAEPRIWAPAGGEELVRGLERARSAFGPAGITLVADLPFSILILAALMVLSPPLAGLAATFCLLLALQAWADQRRLSAPTEALSRAGVETQALLAAALHGAETVRHFRAHDELMRRWQGLAERGRTLADAVGWVHVRGASVSQATQAVLGVAVIGLGALQVVAGTLDVGTLIGANLIAGRALLPFGRIVHFGGALRAAAAALTEARRFAHVTPEREGGLRLDGWRGRLSARALAVGFPGRAEPVFTDVNLDLDAGGVLAVTGRNGSGKSTLLKTIAGLIEPSQGVIAADGVDLRRLSLGWWRGQVSYLPQEPVFLPGTLGDNLRFARPDADDAALMRALAEADLEVFTARYPRPLDLVVEEGGRTLPPGIRRRLGLARALLADGPLYLLDEPSEGLDREGCQVVYKLLIGLAQRGRTLVIVTHDPVILGGARGILRLDGPRPGGERVATRSPMSVVS